VYGERAFVVVGVVLDEPLEEATPPDVNGVHTASVRWEELATYSAHPKADEFARYLGWKSRLSRGLAARAN
jgi:hypothetical protein